MLLLFTQQVKKISKPTLVKAQITLKKPHLRNKKKEFKYKIYLNNLWCFTLLSVSRVLQCSAGTNVLVCRSTDIIWFPKGKGCPDGNVKHQKCSKCSVV